MSSTNKTPNYNLPSFVGTDKMTWLGDINNAFLTIDTALKNISDMLKEHKTLIDEQAQTDVDYQSMIETLQSQVLANTNSLTAFNSAIGGVQQTVTTMNNVIGTDALQTPNRNLVGAVNSLYGNSIVSDRTVESIKNYVSNRRMLLTVIDVTVSGTVDKGGVDYISGEIEPLSEEDFELVQNGKIKPFTICHFSYKGTPAGKAEITWNEKTRGGVMRVQFRNVSDTSTSISARMVIMLLTSREVL